MLTKWKRVETGPGGRDARLGLEGINLDKAVWMGLFTRYRRSESGMSVLFRVRRYQVWSLSERLGLGRRI